MKGKIRLQKRDSQCPNCGEPFQEVGKEGYLCPTCHNRPEKFYIDVHHRNKRVRIFCDKQGKPLDSYDRAYDLLAHINYEIENHIFDPSKYVAGDIKRYLFENLMEQWLELKDKEGIRTAHKYKQFRRDYFIYFKGYDIREIRTSHTHEFYHNLPGHLSNKSKKNILGSLHAFFMWLRNMEHIEKAPLFPKIELDQPDWQWVDVDTQSDLLTAIPEQDRHIFLFLALHGCRPSEARALKIKDLDFNRKGLTIRRTFTGKSSNILSENTKTKKQRVIPINPEMLDILKDLCRNRFGEDFVFLNPRTNEPYAKTTYQEIWDKARKQVNIPIKSYEALRHSFASQRVCRGMDIFLISKVLGHTDIRTTQRYSHTNLDSLKQVMDIPNVSKPSSKDNASGNSSC